MSRYSIRRRQRNEVQEAIQTENEEDHTRQVAATPEAVFITGSPLEPFILASIILTSIYMMTYCDERLSFLWPKALGTRITSGWL
jgi:hypothetical protein